MSNELSETIQGAISSLRNWIEENPNADEPHDYISELADESVPVYNYDRIQCVLEDMSLGCEESDFTTGETDVFTLLGFVIYKRIEEALWEEWRRFEDQRDEAPECAICYEKVFEWQDSIVCTDPDCEEVIHQSCATPETPDPYFCDTHLPEEKETEDDDD